MRIPLFARTSAAALTFVAAVGCADREIAGPGTPTADFSPNAVSTTGPIHVFVLTEERGPSGEFLRALSQRGGEIVNDHDVIGVISVRGLTDDAVSELSELPGVKGVDRDFQVQWIPSKDDLDLEVLQAPAAETDQSGAFFFAERQWNMRQINADDAWLVTPQGEGATVAILDGGLDPFHQDLAGRVDEGTSASFLTPGSSPCNAFLGIPDEELFWDFDFHGTFVGGIVTSNGIGVASVAPDATLIAVKVLNCVGSGSFDDIIAGIVYSAKLGVDVINMSLGAYFPASIPGAQELIDALQRAVRYARQRGVLVVASAGNNAADLDNDDDFIHVPSQLVGVVSVSATGPVDQADFDHFASYSNFGKSGVDVAAPGGDRIATPDNFLDGIGAPCSSLSVFINCVGGVFYLFGGTGTSFAAPHVAGVGAVVESAVDGDQPGWLLEDCIFQGADRVDGPTFSALYGRGRIDVLDSVNRPKCGAGLVATSP